MEILRGIVESPVAPSTSMAWLKGNELKHFSKGKWTTVGVPTVSSVEELDKNASSGSLATVSGLKTEEIEVEDKFSVRDIYVEENPDCEPLMELKVKVPETWPTEAFMLAFGPKGYNNIEELAQGRYLGLMLEEGALVITVFENGSPILNTSPLITDYSVVEETLTQVNEIISSWGGVVCYGVPVESEAPAVTAPTEEQVEAIDSFIGYNTGTHIETIETHINDIYFKETTGWRKINNVKIVDSVDNLDKNAEQGSLASVAVNTFGEVLFSELYQPTEEDFSSPTVPIAKLSKVNGISVIVPDPSIELPEFSIDLYSEDFNPENGVGSIVSLMVGRASLLNLADESQNMEFELLSYNEDEDVLTVNEEALAELNNILSEKSYVYGGTYGVTNEDGDFGLIDSSVSDSIYHVISEVKKTDLYIKDIDGWKVVSDKKLKNKVNEIEAKVDSFVDKTDLIVNSVDELPQDAPIGSLASVLENKKVGEKKYYVNEIKEKELPLYRIALTNTNNPYIQTVGNFSLELKSVDGDILRIGISAPYGYNSNRHGALTWALNSYFNSQNDRSNTICEYTKSGFSRVDLNYDALDRLNQTLSEKEFFVYSGDYLVGQYGLPNANMFIDTYTAIYTKVSNLFIKNEEGWEPYEALKEQSVTTEKVADGAITLDKLSPETYDILNEYKVPIFNSTNFLTPQAPLGSLASIMTKRMDSFSKYLDTTLYHAKVTIPDELPINLPSGEIARFEVTYGQLLNIIIKVEYSSYHGGYAIMISTNGSNSGPVAVYASPYKGGKKLNVNVNNSALQPFESANTGIVAKSVSHPEALDVFLKPYFRDYVLYVKNETGWEQYKELVDKSVTLDKLSEDVSAVIEGCPISVESADNLPSDAKIGTIASVLETTVEEVISGGPSSGLRLKQVEVGDTVSLSMPPNLEFILTAKDGTTIEIRSRASGPESTLYFLDQNKNEYTLAAFSLQNSTVEKNTENIDTLNQLLQSNKYYCKDAYFTQAEYQAVSSYFKSLVHEKEVHTTKVYVKNTAGWEEYDKANKDKVATLESKVAELEAKIQELLQS